MMGAYLRCQLVDKTQALAADDFIQTIKQNQVLMNLGKGVYMTCIKDINEVMQDDDKSQQHKKNIIAMLERDIGAINYKVSGFESVDIGGMPMVKFYNHLASVFVQLNKKFNMNYLHTSCALDMSFRFFTFTDMKTMTQNGRLLSGRFIDPDAYQNKKSILEHTAINFFSEEERCTLNQNAGVEQQRKLFFELVKSSGINIVTCGNCGDIVLHKIKHEGDIYCPHCLFTGDRCDFPDFYD